MEDSHDDQSSCGCKEIFCCIFPTSQTHCHSRQTRDQPPPFPAPTAEEKYRPRFEPKHSDSGFERHVQRQASRSGSDINKAFSDYINQGKIKIRTTSNVGADDLEIVYSKTDGVCDDRDSKKKADANDMFMDYINRVKKNWNIRRTSSLGSKRMISFRKWE